MVKNLPANAGDVGSIPSPGRSHTPRGSRATTCGPEPTSWNYGVRVPGARTLHREAHVTQLRQAHAQRRRPSTAKST